MDRGLGIFCAFVLFLCLTVPSVKSQCHRIDNVDTQQFPERLETIRRLNELSGEFRNRKYTAVEVKPKGRGNYTYTMQICPDADKVKDNAGVVQIDDDSGKTARVLGRFNETDAILSARGDMLALIYTSGDTYTNACGKSERRAIVIIRCNDGITEGELDMLAEAAGTGEDFCHYMLELTLAADSLPALLKHCTSMGSASTSGTSSTTSTSVPVTHSFPVPTTVHVDPSHSTLPPVPDPAVADQGSSHHLSAGSVILIIALVAIVAFLAIGSVYKRYVAGAQGWEQIPFIDFFRRCGSLQADGWKFVTGRGRSAHNNRYDGYSSVSTDDERQPALDRHNNDDHLLPM